jgi:protease-4
MLACPSHRSARRRDGVQITPYRAASLLALLMLAGCTAQPVRLDAIGKLQAEVAPSPQLSPLKSSPLPHRGHSEQACCVAVVDVDGLLLNTDATGLGSWGENPVSLFRERLDAIERDPRIRAVVIRINSPGGSVTATDIMWRDLRAFKRRTSLPLVACLMDVAAGGGYYLATACDQIVAHPTTVTGAIGCILNVYNLQDLMAQFNIIGAPIKAGKNIDLGTPIKALDDEHRELLQTMADEFHNRFRQIVLEHRPNVDGADETTFDGRVFTARQARELNLIDHVGYLDNAVQLAKVSAKLKHAEVVFLHRHGDPALSQYATTPNVPLQKTLIPINVPGLDRSRLPSFLYLWQIEPSTETLLGK